MSDAQFELQRLLDVMKALRDPQTGCPWDRTQDFASIAPFAIEEAYEVLDTITREDWAALPDELGDLLLQVVYHARMAEEADMFDFATIARMITDKMIRRHPHVFSEAEISAGMWENAKEVERRNKREHGTLAGIPLGMPALMRARKLAARASRVGFDWPDAQGVFEKLQEEISELQAELPSAAQEGPLPDDQRARIMDELGDVLFAASSLARKLDLDPEACLRHANEKFTRRFNAVEESFAREGLSMAGLPVELMEERWQAIKREFAASKDKTE